MVWRKVELGQEVGAQNPLLHIGDNEIEVKIGGADRDCSILHAVARDVGAVGRLELCLVGASEALTGCWRENREEGTSVDEVLVVPLYIGHV